MVCGGGMKMRAILSVFASLSLSFGNHFCLCAFVFVFAHLSLSLSFLLAGCLANVIMGGVGCEQSTFHQED